MANPLQPLLNRIPKPLRNRYFLALVLFFGWMIFLDQRDFLSQWKLNSDIHQLEEKHSANAAAIEAAEQERLDLEVNREKIAREDYHMKKKGEDVFIIVPEEKE